MRVFLCVVALAWCVIDVGTAIPPFIHPCSSSDPSLNECITRAIAFAGPKFSEGIPELGIAPLDPLHLGTLTVPNPSLNLVFSDAVVTGLRDFRVNHFRVNQAQDQAVLDFVANVTLKARYEMDGQVLILPIRGKGQSKIKITNLHIVIKYDYQTVNGHWVVTGYKDSYTMDNAVFRFTNLFGGNKQLSDTIHSFINASWELIIKDIAPVAFQQVIKSCVDEAKKLFAAVPASLLLRP